MEKDCELLKEIASGNENAFKIFFEMHKDKLFHFLLKVCKSREMADEILNDVFFKIWMGRELIVEVQNMDAFLFTVAKNKAMDFFRIASRNKKLQQFITERMDTFKEKEADFNLLDHEYKKILKNAIGQLSPKRREIFILSREHGMTHDQIAQHLHLSRNTVRNTMAESLKTIRHYLVQNGVVPSALFISIVTS